MEATPSAVPSRPGLRAGWIVRTAILLLVAVAIVWLVYSSTYAPLSPGSFSGPTTPSVKPVTDGIEPTRYIVIGPTGQRGSMAYHLVNEGNFAVRVGGLATDQTYGITEVGWVPAPGNGELASGHARDVRPFPATIEPGQLIVLWATVTKPPCREGDRSRIVDVPLKWSALGREHVYNLQLGETAGGIGEIALCHPPGALEHLEFPES